MKKYIFTLRLCRGHQNFIYSKHETTLPEIKQIFANIITNDPSVTICEVIHNDKDGCQISVCKYANHGRDGEKLFEDE